MALGQLVVAAVRVEGRSKSEVARTYGVSRRWVHELCKRFDAEGDAGLEPRSRRPHRTPNQTPAEIEDEIVSLRKLLADQGLDAGAHTIAFHLERKRGHAPAVSTIWRILARRGFVTPQPQKRPKSSYIRFEADQPNERWQADITHWKLSDDREIEILNVIDDHSRLLIASHARVTTKAADVVASFHEAFVAHGYPASILTDNGAVFTATYRGRSRCAIELELGVLGIAFHHSRPYHPQTCGKVERFHQTLKKWLVPRPASTIAEVQAHIDAFIDYYNDVRPHRALRRRTPREAFGARPKASPNRIGFVPPRHYRVRRDRVDKSGIVTLRHNSRLHHIGVGRRFKGMGVLVLIADLDIRILSEDGELIRELTLDPTRDYQRQER
jgi:transposase InsO family protein